MLFSGMFGYVVRNNEMKMSIRAGSLLFHLASVLHHEVHLAQGLYVFQWISWRAMMVGAVAGAIRPR